MEVKIKRGKDWEEVYKQLIQENSDWKDVVYKEIGIISEEYMWYIVSDRANRKKIADTEGYILRIGNREEEYVSKVEARQMLIKYMHKMAQNKALEIGAVGEIVGKSNKLRYSYICWIKVRESNRLLIATQSKRGILRVSKVYEIQKN